MRHKSKDNNIGKRMTFYLDNEALTSLKRFLKETGMRSSHTVSGLLRMLSDTEMEPCFTPIYRRVRASLLKEEQASAVKRIEETLSEFQDKSSFSKVDTESLPKFKEDIMLCTSQEYPSLAVLSILEPIHDLSRLIGNTITLQVEHAIKKVIVVVVHYFEFIDPKYTLGLKKGGIYLAPLCDLKSNLNLLLSEQNKEQESTK